MQSCRCAPARLHWLTLVAMTTAMVLASAQPNLRMGSTTTGWGRCVNMTLESGLYFFPEEACLDDTPTLSACDADFSMCKRNATSCSQLAGACVAAYVSCVNDVVANPDTLESCPSAADLHVELINIASGAPFEDSPVQLACFAVVCGAYSHDPDDLCDASSPWTGNSSCVAPTREPLPTTTPVPPGIQYRFTATLADGWTDLDAVLRRIASGLEVPAQSIHVIGVEGNILIFEFVGEDAGLAMQRMLGIQENSVALAVLGLATLSASPYSTDTIPPGQSGDDGMPTYMIVIVSVASVVGAGLLVVLIVLGVKKHKESKLVSFDQYLGVIDEPFSGGLHEPEEGKLMQSRSGRVAPPPVPLASPRSHRGMPISRVEDLPSPTWDTAARSPKMSGADEATFGRLETSFADPFDLGSEGGSFRRGGSPSVTNPLPLHHEVRRGDVSRHDVQQPTHVSPPIRFQKSEAPPAWKDDPDL